MSDRAQKTEKPSPRRLERARREGRFPVSRELVSAIQFLAFVLLLGNLAPGAFARFAGFSRSLLRLAFRVDLGVASVGALGWLVWSEGVSPLLAICTATLLCGFIIQLVVTRFGFAPGKLMPDLSRWNPLLRTRELPKQNAATALHALMLFPLLLLAAYWIIRRQLEAYLALPAVDPRRALAFVAATWEEFLGRAAVAILALGCIDLLRQRRRYLSGLRMSKQELREEMRDSEGNQQIKFRIRRIQRDLARKNMMKEVPLATAIVVNPTHYAVALRYDTQLMAAPRVVAKGKNFLARRIREIGAGHQVPIVENPPLAQALYKSVDVGQEIPAHLYRAVAEILAYIYRLMRPAIART